MSATESWPADIVTYNERRAYMRGLEDGRREMPTQGRPGAAATHPRALDYRPTEWCACFSGTCRCEVVDGLTKAGQRCKATVEPFLQEDAR